MSDKPDLHELDQRLLHLEMVVSRLSEQVRRLIEDMIEVRAGRGTQDTLEARLGRGAT
jgi:uncharacterized coiled-coil protein SlyX